MSVVDIASNGISIVTDIVVQQRVAPDWKWDHMPKQWNRDPGFFLWFVLDGGADLLVDDALHQVGPGDVLLMPTHAHEYHGRHTKHGVFEVAWMIFSCVDVQNQTPVCAEHIQGIPFHASAQDMEFSIRLMEKIVQTQGATRNAWTHAFLDQLRQPSVSRKTSDHNRNISTLVHQIQTNPSQFTGLPDMQAILPVSKDHLIRLFKLHMGTTPGEFLIEARFQQARGLLLISSDSIKEIAFRVGYADQFAFSKQFRKRMGISPRAYRRAHTGRP